MSALPPDSAGLADLRLAATSSLSFNQQGWLKESELVGSSTMVVGSSTMHIRIRTILVISPCLHGRQPPSEEVYADKLSLEEKAFSASGCNGLQSSERESPQHSNTTKY